MGEPRDDAMRRFFLALALAGGLLGRALPARAEGEPDVFARVGVAETELRAGPGVIYGGAFALNFAPDWAVAPYVVLGAGGMHETPKEENIREQRSWFHARVGGGLLVSLRFRLLLRVEVSDFVLFTEDRYKNVQSYV